MTEGHDVVVLGAGPAGCAAATLLARRSHKVALVRPTSPPAGELAESVPPSTRKLLAELGVLEAVESAGFFPNGGNSVWWAGEGLRTETFPETETGFHVDRLGLERVLADAAEKVGVQVHHGTRARTADETEAGWSIRCDTTDGAELELTAPWVLDATGRHGFLARQEGREPDRSTTTLALVRRWRKIGGWEPSTSSHTLVESYADGWAWSVPLDPETRCFTAMIDQRHADLEGSDVGVMLDAELDKTTHLRSTLAGATPTGKGWACPASLYTAQRFGRRGLLMVGDAGSFIDPLSSYGVKKALSSGWLAGVVTHTALVEPEMVDTAVDFFDDRERQVYTSYRRVSERFFAEAADHYASEYWQTRADAARAAGGEGDAEGDPDSVFAAGVPESDVRAAFESIRSRERLRAVAGATVRVFERPGIDGHRIVLASHVASEAYPEGLRYVRGVNLNRLIEVAPLYDDVPEGWSAYNGVASPVTLPDYLTALATSFAAGFLAHDND